MREREHEPERWRGVRRRQHHPRRRLLGRLSVRVLWQRRRGRRFDASHSRMPLPQLCWPLPCGDSIGRGSVSQLRRDGLPPRTFALDRRHRRRRRRGRWRRVRLRQRRFGRWMHGGVLCQYSADVVCPGATVPEEPLYVCPWREAGRRPTDRSSGVRPKVIDHFAAAALARCRVVRTKVPDLASRSSDGTSLLPGRS